MSRNSGCRPSHTRDVPALTAFLPLVALYDLPSKVSGPGYEWPQDLVWVLSCDHNTLGAFAYQAPAPNWIVWNLTRTQVSFPYLEQRCTPLLQVVRGPSPPLSKKCEGARFLQPSSGSTLSRLQSYCNTLAPNTSIPKLPIDNTPSHMVY